MARSPSGVYTPPPSNPVLSGTTALASWANETVGDISIALTDSLSRTGKGAMSAPLAVVAGSEGAPGLVFAGDSDTGIYSPVPNQLAISVAGERKVIVTGGGIEVNEGGVRALDAYWTSPGAVGTPAYSFTDEANTGIYKSAPGKIGIGTLGVERVQIEPGLVTIRSDADVQGDVAASGDMDIQGAIQCSDLEAVGAAGKIGVQSTGGPGFAGALLANGTAATGAVRRTAAKLVNGDLDLDGVVNPDASTPLKNKLTPASMAKAWAHISTSGAGDVTIVGGLNIAAVAIGGPLGVGSYVEITLAQAMSGVNSVAVTVQAILPSGVGSVVEDYAVEVVAADKFRVYGHFTTYPPVAMAPIVFQTTIRRVFVVIHGRQ